MLKLLSQNIEYENKSERSSPVPVASESSSGGRVVARRRGHLAHEQHSESRIRTNYSRILKIVCHSTTKTNWKSQFVVYEISSVLVILSRPRFRQLRFEFWYCRITFPLNLMCSFMVQFCRRPNWCVHGSWMFVFSWIKWLKFYGYIYAWHEIM